MRGGLGVTVLAALAGSARAEAEILGEAGAGVLVEERGPAVTAGVRGGITGASIGALLGVAWIHPFHYEGADYTETEHRVRFVGALALPIQQAANAHLLLRLGGGGELAHLTTCGFLPSYSCRSETNHGYVVEAGASYVIAAGPVYVGGDVAFAYSSHSGTSAAVALVLRVAR